MKVLLIILLIIISLPGASYVSTSIYIDLPKKVGYIKYLLIILFYIMFGAFTIYLLTVGYIDLLSLLVLNILIEIPVIYYLRKEIIGRLKKDFTMKGDKDSDEQ